MSSTLYLTLDTEEEGKIKMSLNTRIQQNFCLDHRRGSLKKMLIQYYVHYQFQTFLIVNLYVVARKNNNLDNLICHSLFIRVFSNVNKYFIMNKHQNVLKCKQTVDTYMSQTFSNLKMVFRKLVMK